MSFELPRRFPELRFTGSVRALRVETPDPEAPPPPPTLGRARPKAPAVLAPPPAPVRGPDVYALEPEPTPYFEGVFDGEATGGRPLSLSMSDDETLMLERDDAALARAKANAAAVKKALAIPNFRGATQIVPMPPKPAPPATDASPRRFPIAVWLTAAVVAGILSYRVAPVALAQVEGVAKAFTR